MTEIFKIRFDLNPPFTKDDFIEQSITNNLRHSNDAHLSEVWTTSFGVETLADMCQT